MKELPSTTKEELKDAAILISGLEPEEKKDLIKALTLAKLIFKKEKGEDKDKNGPGGGGGSSREGEKIA